MKISKCKRSGTADEGRRNALEDTRNRLVETGMEINVDKSKVMRLPRIVNCGKLRSSQCRYLARLVRKETGSRIAMAFSALTENLRSKQCRYFAHLVTKDAKETGSRIPMALSALTTRRPLLKRTPRLALRKKLIKCNGWSRNMDV